MDFVAQSNINAAYREIAKTTGNVDCPQRRRPKGTLGPSGRSRQAHIATQQNPAVAERLGDMKAPHAVARLEIGEGAGDAEDAVVAAGGEMKALAGVDEEALAVGVGGGDLVQELAVQLGVGADAA